MLAVNQLIGFGAGGGATNAWDAVANWSTTKFLRRTPAANGSDKIFTFSAWVRRAASGARQIVAGGDTSGAGNIWDLEFTAADRLFSLTAGGGGGVLSTGSYASTTAWYHIVTAWDTNQATAASRLRLYVNGAEVAYDGTSAYPGLSAAYKVNTTANNISVGNPFGTAPFNGRIAHAQFVDGAQLTPSAFSQPGIGGTVPKRYEGAFGTNGWLLDFANSADIGNDVSGNNLDLTVTGLVAGDVSAEQVFY